MAPKRKRDAVENAEQANQNYCNGGVGPRTLKLPILPQRTCVDTRGMESPSIRAMISLKLPAADGAMGEALDKEYNGIAATPPVNHDEWLSAIRTLFPEAVRPDITLSLMIRAHELLSTISVPRDTTPEPPQQEPQWVRNFRSCIYPEDSTTEDNDNGVHVADGESKTGPVESDNGRKSSENNADMTDDIPDAGHDESFAWSGDDSERVLGNHKYNIEEEKAEEETEEEIIKRDLEIVFAQMETMEY